MKLKLFFALSLSLIFYAVSAQSDPPKTDEDKVFEMFDIQKQPLFPGGEPEMYKFISQNMKYPALAKENNIQGLVVLQFVIDKDGSVTSVNILKDIGGGCGKEAVRVMQAMPNWTPGEANGHPVKVRYTLPFRYKLEGDSPSQPATLEVSGPLSSSQMWEAVVAEANKKWAYKEPKERSAAFNSNDSDNKAVILNLEIAFFVKTSELDRASFKTLGDLSDYLHKAQYAPQFFGRPEYGGRTAKMLSNRADFDLNADGLGKIGSLKVPKGIRIVLYSKKKFKGKALEIDATESAIELPNLEVIATEKSKIKDSGKGLNWGLHTKSVKIILPKGFPEGQ